VKLQLPEGSGSYRWYYVDVSAGDFTAVFIFMVGSIFSARYSASLKRGGMPREHSAVNFALYEKGVRWQWVLSEYQQVSLDASQRRLNIGNSWFEYGKNGTLKAYVREKTAPWGKPAEVELELTPECPEGPELLLVETMGHKWQPVFPRAKAKLYLPREKLSLEGAAYHDGNHGPVPLGSDLRGWEWTRVHRPDATEILYRPWGGAPALKVKADAKAVKVERVEVGKPKTVRSGWGLPVPVSLGVGGAPNLIESSPFYARMDASDGNAHAVGEVADFRRFHSPWVRWMAHFRTRNETAADGRGLAS
jgi:carotenoid 1,2-hydratase